MNREEPSLRVRNLSFAYPEYPGLPARELFAGLELELPAGSFTVLLGLPDTGKTTLCRILSGLLPRFSGGDFAGTVRLPGGELGERAPFELVEEVGLVFQNPADQLFTSRCELEVAFALESLGRDPEDMRSRVAEALRWMGLEPMRDRDPLTLSGGEKKKLLLACLHAVDPPLWLLDETLDELDSGSRLALLEHAKRRARTVLLLSARWYDVLGDYADRVLLLEDKKIRLLAGSRNRRDLNRELERAGLSMPRGSAGLGTRPVAAAPVRSVWKTEARPLIEARDLSFRYSGDNAFELNVSRLAVAAGETIALIGANGSGKTTLGRLMCGLLEPREGSVLVPQDGALRPAAARMLNAYAGYLFQDPDLQIFLPTVADELAYGLKLRRLDSQRIGGIVEDAIARFRLPGPEVPPALMSYGARKRLQAAVCALLERPVLVVDEGDSGLGALEFRDLLGELRSPERGLVFITHDMELARRLADRAVELRAGRVV